MSFEQIAYKFIEKFLGQVAVKAVEKIFTPKKVPNTKEEIENSIFTQYINNLLQKYSHTKTLINRQIPIPLLDYYVPLKVSCNKKTISSKSISSYLSLGNRLVCIGTAGSGKSTLLKWTLLSIIHSHKWGFPLYFELRNINNNKQGVLPSLCKCLTDLGLSIKPNELESCLETGKFILLFDGLDEVNPNLVNQVENEIIKIGDKYPATKILVSSRPDQRFISWGNYLELNILPFSKSQALELVNNIPCEKGLKENFSNDLNHKLFKTNHDFAKNPLMLIIMLLTYEQYAGFPEKMHLFFQVAFQTLFYMHDASKGQYKRQHYSNLPIDHFTKIISAFSISSFKTRQIVFTNQELMSHLDNARLLSSIKFDSNAVLKDLLKSLCILLKDGLQYSFTHRTFQEFFASKFITKQNDKVKKKMINKLLTTHGSTNVVRMISEMDSIFFQEKIVLPLLQDCLKKIKNMETTPFKAIEILVSSFTVQHQGDGAHAFSIKHNSNLSVKLLALFDLWDEIVFLEIFSSIKTANHFLAKGKAKTTVKLSATLDYERYFKIKQLKSLNIKIIELIKQKKALILKNKRNHKSSLASILDI